MAEAFVWLHAPPGYETASCGSSPSGRVNPRAITLMDERGIDLSEHRSTGLADGHYDVVITMGCGDECPVVGATRHEDWPLDDPKNLPDADVRRIRDEIERRVLLLLDPLADD